MSKKYYTSDYTKSQLIEELNGYSKRDKSGIFNMDYQVSSSDAGFVIENKRYQSRFGLSRVKVKGEFINSDGKQKLLLIAKPDPLHVISIIFMYAAFTCICFTKDQISINGELIIIDTYFKIKWVVGTTIGFGLLFLILVVLSIRLMKSWTIEKLRLRPAN